MPKRRMSQIMGQCNGLDEIFVQLQRAGDTASELRHFQGMRQACAKQITFVIQKNLCFVNQAPKRRGMHNPIPIPLVIGSRRGDRLWQSAPARLRRVTRVGR